MSLDMVPLAAHPATDLFPLLEDAELQALTDDIRAHGLIHPVVLHEGRVLDGRNRLRACEMAGVEPRFEEWQAEGRSPTQWVISTNLHRRHMDTSQRAAVAVEMLPLLAAEAKQRQGRRTDLEPTSLQICSEVGKQEPRRAAEEAAELVNVSARTVYAAKYVKEHDPAAFAQVKEGKTTLNAAVAAVKQGPRDRARPVANPAKTRAAINARRERIIEMAQAGYHEAAISDEVGVGEQTVRDFLSESGIGTLAHRTGRKYRPPQSDRVMEGLVDMAMPPLAAVAVLDWSTLDPDRIRGWETRLAEAIREWQRLLKRLREWEQAA